MARNHHRHDISNARVYINRENDDANHTYTYAVNNISRGGLQFTSSDNYQVDEHLNIRLDIGNGDSHEAHARICYCLTKADNKQQYDYGISYLDNFFKEHL